MSVTERPQVADIKPQWATELHDPDLGRLGFVVVDRLCGGTSVGGIRCAPDVTIDEVAGLARAMTLKNGFLGLPQGGAKAGIVLDDARAEAPRGELMRAFGRAIGAMVRARLYLPGEDLGTTPDDLSEVMRGAGFPASIERSALDGGRYAALGTAEAIRHTCRVHGIDLTNAAVAIQGFGRVGAELARQLADDGVRLVAVSTVMGALYDPAGLPIEELLRARQAHGDRCVVELSGATPIPRDEIPFVEADILVPCARPWSITAENAHRVRARAVVSAANIAVTPAATRILHDRSVVTVPDFVSNGGTVLAAYLASQGFRTAEIDRVVVGILGPSVRAAVTQARVRGCPVTDVAEEWAWRQLETARNGARGRPRLSIGRVARALVRRGHGRDTPLRRLALGHLIREITTRRAALPAGSGPQGGTP